MSQPFRRHLSNSAGKTTSANFLPDDSRLHKLCHDGNLKKIRAFVKDMDPHVLGERLANRKRVFGYTPLHEAVASGKPEVLKFLLEQTAIQT